MTIAIPHWQGRIAPVFDVAGRLLLVDVENGRVVHREEVRLLKNEAAARVVELLRYGTRVLICGAVSAPLQLKLAAAGVQVVAFVCGAVDDVLAAYLNGTLSNWTHAMPGCQRWRWRNGEDVLPFGRGRASGRRQRFRRVAKKQ
jgi:predicted Fe-Mo cluster-binding NifX family protein